MFGNTMKKTLLIFILMTFIALLFEYHGYSRGFNDGEKTTNSWWIDKKSQYYDTSQVIKKRLNKKHHLM